MNEKGIRLTGCAGKTPGENGKKGTTEEARQCNSKSCHQSFSIAIAMDWDFSPTHLFEADKVMLDAFG